LEIAAVEPLEREIAELIIASTGLEDVKPEDIDPAAPLFGDGLGLDSIDALEIGVALSRKYGLKLKADGNENRRHFASVRTLAAFVASQRAGAA
jgi:acyl carrier protein